MITPTPRGLVCPGYCNHSDAVADIWGNVYAAFTCGAAGHPAGLLIRRRQHGTGLWATISELPATAEHKYGYCSLVVVGAHLVVLASERQADGSTPVHEYLVAGAVTEFAVVTS